MSDIVKLPVEKVYPGQLSAAEMWAEGDIPEDMVWEVCPYLRMHLEEMRCKHCHRWEIKEGLEHHGLMQMGCFGLASEACRVILAMQKKLLEQR